MDRGRILSSGYPRGDNRNGGWRDARYSPCLTKRRRADGGEAFHDLPRQAGNADILKIRRNRAGTLGLHAGALLRVTDEIATILALGLERGPINLPGFIELKLSTSRKHIVYRNQRSAQCFGRCGVNPADVNSARRQRCAVGFQSV